MTNRQKAMTERAAALVGSGYLYGATGWVCTQARIEAQAKQYPQYAAQIHKYGPKWLGKACFDCAQLTRAAAKAGGIALPSGATSQYKAGVYAARGRIDTLPAGEPGIQLWREDGKKPGTMAHTGLSMGDGTAVEARGHQYGVVRRAVSASPWTHWGRFAGVGVEEADGAATSGAATSGAAIGEGQATPEGGAVPERAPTAQLLRLIRLSRPLMRGEDVRLIQQLLLAHDIRCLPTYGADGVFGAETYAAVLAFQQAAFPGAPREWDGVIGTKTWEKLTTV